MARRTPNSGRALAKRVVGATEDHANQASTAGGTPLSVLTIGVGVLGAAFMWCRRQKELRSWKTASDEKDRFLASVSHELRTPLTAIIGMLDLLVDDETRLRSSEFDEFLLAARQQAYEMGRLVDDYVIAGRLTSRALTLQIAAFDLDTAVSDVIQGVDLIGAVRLHVETPLGMAKGDALRVRQIARNLVRNAVRYATSEVVVSTVRNGTTVVLEVRNDGPPVPDGMEDHLFEWFVGSERPGQPDPLGLGLAISRELAHRMGGDLSYRRDGSWTVFSLSLSTEPAHRKESTRPSTPQSTSGARASDLESAVDASEWVTGLALVVQPIVDLREGQIVGYETLARVVGDNGRVLHWPQAIEVYSPSLLQAQAVRRAMELRSMQPIDSFLAVNVDPHLLTSPSVQQAFDMGEDLTGMVIELTGTSRRLDAGGIRTLARLRSRGALIAIDGVQPGSANIDHFSQLVVSYVKLTADALEPDDVDRRAASLFEVAERIESGTAARIIVTGIERLTQIEALVTGRLPLAQGYMLGRPAPPFPMLDSMIRGQLIAFGKRWAADATLAEIIERSAGSSHTAGFPAEVVLAPSGDLRLRWGSSIISSPMRALATDLSHDVLRRAMARSSEHRFTPIVAIDIEGTPIGCVTVDMLIGATLLPASTK